MDFKIYKRGKYWHGSGWRKDKTRWRKTTHQTEEDAAWQVARGIALEESTRTKAESTRPRNLKQAAYAVFAQDVRKGNSEATKEYHVQKLFHPLRILGCNFCVDSVTREQLEAYADARFEEETCSAHTVRKELEVIRLAIRASGNPWQSDMMPDLGCYYEPKSRYLTLAELEALLAELTQDRQEYVLAFCYTGFDLLPLWRLTRDEVDLGKNLIFANDTKGRKRSRWLKIHNAILPIIQRRYFLAKENEPLFPVWGNIQRDLKAACKRAGIDPLSPKDFRRTFCSWLANAGVSELECSVLMGHTSSKMVREVYAQFSSERKAEAVNMLPSLKNTKPVNDTVDPGIAA